MGYEESFQMNEISSLTCWYQPIYRLDQGEVLGYEALVRSSVSRPFSPLELFRKAKSSGNQTALDCWLIAKAQQLVKDSIHRPLFINIFPSTLLHPDFLCWWDCELSVLDPVVLELSESEPIEDWTGLRLVVRELQNRGVKIALDDMGAGYSFLQHWIELKPDYVKLDRYYGAGLTDSDEKQRVLESMVELFNPSSQVILEGLEEQEDIQVAQNLGVRLAQGYALAKPAPWSQFSINASAFL